MFKLYEDAMDYLNSFADKFDPKEDDIDQFLANEISTIVESVNDAKIVAKSKINKINYALKFDLEALINKYKYAKDNNLLNEEELSEVEKEIIGRASGIFVVDCMQHIVDSLKRKLQ